MKRLSLLLQAAALTVSLTVSAPMTIQADEPWTAGARDHLQKLEKDGGPGVAVLAARDGEIVFQHGVGLADVENRTPITTGTKFRIGSVSKQFIAAAVLRLCDQGKLSIDDPLEKFFPGFPRGDAITLHHLLTHTSGIRSYTDKPEFLLLVTRPVKPDKLIAFFRADPPDFAPAAGYHYNNSGYFLAGEIVARTAGMPLDAALRALLFDPLDLKDTGVFLNASPPDAMARGYEVADGNPKPALDWDMSWAGGAGALYSTIGDLHRWCQALHGGRVLKPESLKRMTTPIELPADADGAVYGYGVMLAPVHRLPCVSHGGGLHGWSSDLLYFPEQRCTIVALANALPAAPGSAPGEVTRALASKVLEAAIAKLPSPAEDASVDRSRYPDYSGRYDYKNGVMTVTAEDGRLFAKLTGQEKAEIFPAGEDTFFWKIVDARVQFLRDEAGNVTAARHTQGGAFFKAPRLTGSAVTLTEADLDAILGQYQYGPGAVLTVTRDGDQVFAQITNQPKFAIFPQSATEFEWKVVPAKVSFIKDSDGAVTHATHSQNGATFDAPKIK